MGNCLPFCVIHKNILNCYAMGTDDDAHFTWELNQDILNINSDIHLKSKRLEPTSTTAIMDCVSMNQLIIPIVPMIAENHLINSPLMCIPVEWNRKRIMMTMLHQQTRKMNDSFRLYEHMWPQNVRSPVRMTMALASPVMTRLAMKHRSAW